ncbi:hypothetical protein AALA00_12510 [Lachnospiraceae bacterium 46-15]
MSGDGLLVWYDRSNYRVFYNGTSKEYPIGGLACEYSRFKPYTLKDVIMDCPFFSDDPKSEGVTDKVAKWIYDALFENYDPVTASMIFAEIGDYIHDYFIADDDDRKGFLDDLNADINDDKVKQFILKDSGLDKFDLATMGGMLLSAYCTFGTSYVAFRHSLDILANDGGEAKEEDAFLDF